jgi:TfoX/Sxy family transcriptional regulator of competence genes
MAYDEGLAERIREALSDYRGIEERMMFGGIAFLSRGYMFLGVTDELLMARVGPESYEDALSKPHVRVMDFTGRPMKGYVFVAPPGFESETDLAEWARRTHRFVQSLPPKKKK